MSKAIIMPQVGQDIETAIISEWKIKENDVVEKGDIIAIVDSDKASFEVEAFESGVVRKLLYKEGEEAKVFEPIAYLGSNGDDGEEESREDKAQRQDVSAPVSSSFSETKEVEYRSTKSRIFASPLARKIAKEHDIDLNQMAGAGSGPSGRIIKRDILSMLEKQPAIAKESRVPAMSARQIEGQEEILFNKMRSKIAERLVKSKQTIPHYYLFMDVDVTLAASLRSAFNSSQQMKISINDMVVLSTARALAKFPKINSHVSSDRLSIKKDINIGIAVSVEDGLLVPVIPNADQKSIKEISVFSKQISEQAQAGMLQNHNIGTFTISNLGMYEVDSFLPIINPPEAAILGVGKVDKRVRPVANNAISVRDILTLSLVCDHRAVDGTYAAQFLKEVKSNLENLSL